VPHRQDVSLFIMGVCLRPISVFDFLIDGVENVKNVAFQSIKFKIKADGESITKSHQGNNTRNLFSSPKTRSNFVPNLVNNEIFCPFEAKFDHF
jgi:hypothetical protein